jgi:hypothetical protein
MEYVGENSPKYTRGSKSSWSERKPDAGMPRSRKTGSPSVVRSLPFAATTP